MNKKTKNKHSIRFKYKNRKKSKCKYTKNKKKKRVRSKNKNKNNTKYFSGGGDTPGDTMRSPPRSRSPPVRAPDSPGLDSDPMAAVAAAMAARKRRTTALQLNVPKKEALSYAAQIIENYKTYWEQYSHNSQMTLDIISLLVGKFSQVSENLEKLMESEALHGISEYLSATYPDTPLGILIQLLEKIQSITSTGVRGGGQCGGSSAGDGSQGVAADQPNSGPTLLDVSNLVLDLKKNRDEEVPEQDLLELPWIKIAAALIIILIILYVIKHWYKTRGDHRETGKKREALDSHITEIEGHISMLSARAQADLLQNQLAIQEKQQRTTEMLEAVCKHVGVEITSPGKREIEGDARLKSGEMDASLGEFKRKSEILTLHGDLILSKYYAKKMSKMELFTEAFKESIITTSSALLPVMALLCSEEIHNEMSTFTEDFANSHLELMQIWRMSKESYDADADEDGVDTDERAADNELDIESGPGSGVTKADADDEGELVVEDFETTPSESEQVTDLGEVMLVPSGEMPQSQELPPFMLALYRDATGLESEYQINESLKQEMEAIQNLTQADIDKLEEMIIMASGIMMEQPRNDNEIEDLLDETLKILKKVRRSDTPAPEPEPEPAPAPKQPEVRRVRARPPLHQSSSTQSAQRRLSPKFTLSADSSPAVSPAVSSPDVPPDVPPDVSRRGSKKKKKKKPRSDTYRSGSSPKRQPYASPSLSSSRKIKQRLEGEKQKLDEKSSRVELSPSEQVRIDEIDEIIAEIDTISDGYEKLSELFTKQEAWMDAEGPGKKSTRHKHKKAGKKTRGAQVAPDPEGNRPRKRSSKSSRKPSI